MIDLKEILTRIEHRCQELNRTSADVARAAGKADAIRNMRKASKYGSASTVTVSTLAALADELGVSIGWLISGEGAPPAAVNQSSQRPHAQSSLEQAIAVTEGAMLSAGLKPEYLGELRALLRECLEEPLVLSNPQSEIDCRRAHTKAAVTQFLKQRSAQGKQE